jgi:basic amino acid/polyamine antiporter, APA family
MLMNYTKGLVSAFTFVILLATLTTLIPYAYSAAAQAWMYFTEPELFERKNFFRDTLIAALAFGYSVWAITGSGKDIIAKGFVLLLAGIPVYVLMKGWQRREALKAAYGRRTPTATGPAVARPLGPAGLAHRPTGVDQ